MGRTVEVPVRHSNNSNGDGLNIEKIGRSERI